MSVLHRRSSALLALGLVGCTLPAMAFEQQWPIELQDQQAALQRLTLPVEAYAFVRDAQLRDIEVRDRLGASLPAALEPARRAEEDRWEEAVAVFPLPVGEELQGEGLRALIERGPGNLSVQIEVDGPASSRAAQAVWLLDLGSESGLTESLRLDIPATNSQTDAFATESGQPEPNISVGSDWVARVSIEESHNLQSWRVLVGGFDLYRIGHQGHRLGVLGIDLPRTPQRFLRMRWDSGEAPPGATLLAGKRRAQFEPPADAELLLEAAAGAGVEGWQFVLPGPLLVRALALEFGDQLWLAEAEWSSRIDAEQPWLGRGRNEVYRLQAAGAVRTAPALHLAPNRDIHWRVQLRPDMARPPKLRVTVTPDRLVFAPSGQPPYRLLIGSRTHRRVDAPFASLIGQRDGAGSGLVLADARLGQGGAVGPDDIEPEVKVEVDWKRYALWGALALGVLLIAGMVRTLLREAG